MIGVILCVNVCVCVCVRARARARVSMCIDEWKSYDDDVYTFLDWDYNFTPCGDCDNLF